ncbi:mediator of RNA polymerase II transcription subunit 22, partial [Salmonella sp. s51228]|uniref:mediator of RNA polymerase II transcription subunit 22 n=1 Tax=Salmonella sp. s51228 TaxID=3159652 RepID=UPI00398117AF
KQIMQVVESLLVSNYNRQLKDIVKEIDDNYWDIIQIDKIKDPSNQDSFSMQQEQFEMSVRASLIVKSAEFLSKLVSDIKEHIFLNDFSVINS